MPARTKRHYSVKEAAKILGVSTNTVYSYLLKGNLRAKRLGRGRFKILASDLAPYFSNIEKNVEAIGKKSSLFGFLGIDKGYEVKGNFLFWRIYLAYLMLSVGMVHFFWRQNLLISLPLTFAGILTLFVAENWKKHKTLSTWTHLIDFLVLTGASIVAFINGYFYMLLFLGTCALTVLLQVLRGVNKLSEEGSLMREFTISTLLGTIFLIILLLAVPNFLPFSFLTNFILGNRIAIAFGIAVATLPLVFIHYVISSSHLQKRSHLEYFILPVYSVVSEVVAICYTNLGIWDVAFAAFFYAFLAFVVIWLRHAGTINVYHKNGLLVTFGWVGVAITMGILSIYIVQARLKMSALQSISEKTDVIVNNINDFFTISESTIISNVADNNLSAILSSKNKNAAQEFARNLFDKLTNVNRVLVYDDQGIAIGVYPRSSITEGTDFSSRDYFQIAKSTGHPYLSSLFESVVGSRTILFAVPVYSGTRFLGEVGVAYNLEALSKLFQTATTGGKIFAFDRSGKYVLDADASQIGTSVPKNIVENFDQGKYETDNALLSCESAGVPEWKVCKSVNINDVTQILYISNIIIVIFLFVNATQSLRAGFSLSERNKVHV